MTLCVQFEQTCLLACVGYAWPGRGVERGPGCSLQIPSVHFSPEIPFSLPTEEREEEPPTAQRATLGPFSWGRGEEGAAFLPTYLFSPSPWGPKLRRLLQPSASRARGGSSERAPVSHKLCHFSEASTPTPGLWGEARVVARATEVGQRVPTASKGQVGPPPKQPPHGIWGRAGPGA